MRRAKSDPSLRALPSVAVHARNEPLPQTQREHIRPKLQEFQGSPLRQKCHDSVATQPTPSWEPASATVESISDMGAYALKCKQARRIDPTQILSANQKDCIIKMHKYQQPWRLCLRIQIFSKERRRAGRGLHICDEAAIGKAGYIGVQVVVEPRSCLKGTDIILQSSSRDS